MASLKDLRNRISSVKATQKITKAMQMVAAAKLRRAQDAAESARPYAQRMSAMLSNLIDPTAENLSGPALLSGNGKDQTHLLVVATADRGLCGGFNSNIARLAIASIRKLQGEGKTVKILCVGNKGYDQLKGRYSNLIIDTVTLREVKKLSYDDALAIGTRVIEMFDNDEFDVATLFYSKFENVITQIPTPHQLIPAQVDQEEGDDDTTSVDAADKDYEFEPSETAILNDLLPRNVSTQIFRGLLENAASEQGARMSAMDNATRNAGDMIDRLTLLYNRTRQAQITSELIEIISGAEAL